MLLRAVEKFLRHDAAGGILLMASAVLALVVANSPAAGGYDNFLNSMLSITLNGEGLDKPMILWINDGLMAVFFFLVGLELKREMLEGRLKNPRDVILPGMAAVGGMVVPALIYASLNWGTEGISGWAIPAATDIAFALGVLALLGDRVPPSLKIFLLTLAILDDIGAILIIAIFYSHGMSVQYLLLAVLPILGLLWLNMRGTHRIAPAILLGVILWFFVLKSGIHATIAGVITAFLIPLKDKFGKSPLHRLEDGLSPYVLYLIVPLFAFANAGVVLHGISASDAVSPLPLGIIGGLVLGKQIGVMGMCFLLIKLGGAKLPNGASWMQLYGVACLAGIGFTMSLFIGTLSFTSNELMNEVRLGVLVGSVISAVLGFIVLRLASSAQKSEPVAEAAE
ncbi:MAG: Na+/H+ antiporter NhaA [Deltaproteobacteria bacterium]